MNKRKALWVIPAILYTLFVVWYTDFGGPLTEAEINRYTSTMRENGSDKETIEFIEGFMRGDSGRQFLMVNNIDNNDNPPPVEGAPTNASADDLMSLYMEYMIPALLSRGCHPVLMGNAVYNSMDIVGIAGAEDWSSGALFRYRSRRDFMDIVVNPAFRGRHDFKEAALEKTVAYPIETTLYLGDPRFLLGLILLAMTALLDVFLYGRKR